MSAPEKIYVWEFKETLGCGNWTEGSNDHYEIERAELMGTTQYTRQDIHNSLLAENERLREALEDIQRRLNGERNPKWIPDIVEKALTTEGE